MGSLFIQLIKDAKEHSPDILPKEGWESILNYVSTTKQDSLTQLRTLVKSFYGSEVIKKSEVQQLIADMITVFCVFQEPSAEKYEALIQMLLGDPKQLISSLHAKQLQDDLIMLRVRQIENRQKNKKELEDFKIFLKSFTPPLAFPSLKIRKSYSTKILFAPFSKEKGEAYIHLVSMVIKQKKDNSKTEIDIELESKLLGCYDKGTVKFFTVFVVDQFLVGKVDEETYEALISHLARRLVTDSYINLVKILLSDYSANDMEKFLIVTLPIIVGSLKSSNAKDRLKMIQFIQNDLQKKFPSLSMLNECVNNIIQFQLGEENYCKVTDNLRTIKFFEERIRNIEEIPDGIEKRLKALKNNDLEEEFKQIKSTLSEMKKTVEETQFSESIQNEIEGKNLTNFSNLLEELTPKSQGTKEALARTYESYDNRAKNFLGKVNDAFKQEISVEKYNKENLTRLITANDQKLSKKTLLLENIKERISETENKQKISKNKLSQFFSEKSVSASENNFIQFLQKPILPHITEKIKKIDKEIGKNRRRQWQKNIQYRFAKNAFFRTVLFLKNPWEIKLTLEELEKQEVSLVKQHTSLSSMKKYHIPTVIKLAQQAPPVFLAPMEMDIGAIDVFGNCTGEFLGENPQDDIIKKLKGFLEEIRNEQANYRMNGDELKNLEKQADSLDKEITTMRESTENFTTQLEIAKKKIDILDQAYKQYHSEQIQFETQEVENFLNMWRKEHQLSTGEKIDFQFFPYFQERLLTCVKEGYSVDTEHLLQNAINWNMPVEFGSKLLFLAYSSYARAETENKKNNFNRIVEILEENGAKFAPNEVDEEKNTVLHWVAKTGDVKRAEKWFSEHGGISREIFNLLNLSDLSINQKNHEGDTPLHLAVKYKNVEMIALLLEKGAATNIQNKSGETPFNTPQGKEFLSTLDKNTSLYAKLVNMQLIKKEEPHNTTDVVSNPPHRKEKNVPDLLEKELHDKSVEANLLPYWLEEIKVFSFNKDLYSEGWMSRLKNAPLEEKRRLVNAQDKHGNTILHTMIEKGNVGDVEYLLNYGADTMIKNNKGKTAFELAKKYWEDEQGSVKAMAEEITGQKSTHAAQKIYQLVKESGSSQTAQKYSSSMRLIENMQRLMGDLLTEYEKVLSELDEQQKGLTDYQTHLNKINVHLEKDNDLINAHKLASEALKNGEKNTEKLKGLLTTQQIAIIEEGKRELINEIKEKIADAKRLHWYANKKGDRPIHMRVKQGSIESLKNQLNRLHESNPEELKKLINTSNESGYTPLHLAIAFSASGIPKDKKTSLEMVKLLIENGAEVNLKDAQGRTVVEIAKKCGNDEVIRFITLHENKPSHLPGGAKTTFFSQEPVSTSATIDFKALRAQRNEVKNEQKGDEPPKQTEVKNVKKS